MFNYCLCGWHVWAQSKISLIQQIVNSLVVYSNILLYVITIYKCVYPTATTQAFLLPSFYSATNQPIFYQILTEKEHAQKGLVGGSFLEALHSIP